MPSRGFFSRAVHSSSSVKPGPASLPPSSVQVPHPIYAGPAPHVKNGGWWGVPPWLHRGNKGLPRHSSGPIPQVAPSGPSSYPGTSPGTHISTLPGTLPANLSGTHPGTLPGTCTSTLPGRTSHHPYYFHRSHHLEQKHQQLKLDTKHHLKVEQKHPQYYQHQKGAQKQLRQSPSRPPSVCESRPHTPHDPYLTNGSDDGPQSLPARWETPGQHAQGDHLIHSQDQPDCSKQEVVHQQVQQEPEKLQPKRSVELNQLVSCLFVVVVELVVQPPQDQ